MAVVAKREMTDEQKRERTQARVGLASNVLGLAAGTAALATAAQNPALRSPNPSNAGPVTRRVAGKLKMKPRTAARLFRAGAAGAVGLQAANLGGDIVANRVLSREAKKGGDVKKSIEQTYVSKSDEVRVTGHGVNIAKGKFSAEEHAWYDRESGKAVNRARNEGRFIGGLNGAALGGLVGVLAARGTARRVSAGRAKAVLAGSGAAGATAGGVAGGAIVGSAARRDARRKLDNPQAKYLLMMNQRHAKQAEKAVEKAFRMPSKNAPLMREARRLRTKSFAAGAAGGVGVAAIAAGATKVQRDHKEKERLEAEKKVAKRYYDPEMDRQRRLGMYAGAGLAGSAGLAALGARGIAPAVREVEGGRVVRGLSMPKGKKARGKLALLAAAAASGAGGLTAYKRSNSRKNDPWD